MELSLGGRMIGDGHPTFIVAEIGQNHQGDPYLASRLVGEAVRAGADAVKFQLRDCYREFTEERLNAPHPNSEHAFGQTYKQHRLNLDLTIRQLDTLRSRVQYNEWPIKFFVTPCYADGVEDLEAMGMEFYKIASKDNENEELIEAVRKTGKPAICSVTRYRDDRRFNVQMYCVPKHPTPLADIDLSRVAEIAEHTIAGFSDHSGSPYMASPAVALGADIVEVHLTASKLMRGNDHKASLTPYEFRRMVESVRATEAVLGCKKVMRV